MPPRRTLILIAALLAGPRTFPQTTAPTTAYLATAIDNLAADDAETREAASRQLFVAGLVAEPALRKAAASDIPEVRTRAQRILNHFAHGIFSETPPDVIDSAARYAGASDTDKRAVLRDIIKQPGYGYTVLARLAEEETDSDLKDFIERLMVNESRRVPEVAAQRLLAGDVDAADRLLAIAARGGEETPARAFAALRLTEGRLDAAIASTRQRLTNADPADAQKTHRTLAYLLRGAGKLDEAADAAKASADAATIRGIALERGDWRALADIIAAALPPADAAQQSAGELGVLAAAERWSGDAQGFNQAIDRLIAVARSNDTAFTAAVQALLLNGRTASAIDLLIGKARYAAAFDLLIYAARFDDALALSNRAKDEHHADALSLAAHAGQIRWRLGFKQQALDALDAVAAELAPAQTYDLATYVALCNAERDVARTEPARAAKPRQFAIIALNGAPPNTPFNALFDKLFPGLGPRALQWWDVLRQLRPNDSVESRFDTVSTIINRTIPNAEFDGIARSAVNGAWLGHLNDNVARERVLSLVSETLVAAGRSEAADTYLDMLATQREIRHDWLDVGLRFAEKKDFARAADYFAQVNHSAEALWLAGWAAERANAAGVKKGWSAIALQCTLGDERQMAAIAGAMETHGEAEGALEQRRRITRVGTPRSFHFFDACKYLGNDASHRGDLAAAAHYWETFLLTTMELNVSYSDPVNYIELPQLIYRTRARARYLDGKLAEAAEQFKICLANAPTHLQLPLDCVPELRKLAREKPGASGQAYEVAARALFDEVSKKIQSLLARYPDSAFLHNELAWLCVRCDYDADVALAHASRAIELLPRDSNSIDTLAEVYFRRGDRAKAIELMKQCEVLDPAQPRHRLRREEFEKQKQ